VSLSSLMKSFVITGEMIERRDRVRSLYGDNHGKKSRYDDATKPARVIIKGIAKQDGTDLVRAAMKICKLAVSEGNGGAVSLVIAALVDLCEEQDKANENRQAKTT